MGVKIKDKYGGVKNAKNFDKSCARQRFPHHDGFAAWLAGLAGLFWVVAWFFPHSDDDIFVPAGLDVLPAFLHL